jgi:hypothetical protein
MKLISLKKTLLVGSLLLSGLMGSAAYAYPVGVYVGGWGPGVYVNYHPYYHPFYAYHPYYAYYHPGGYNYHYHYVYNYNHDGQHYHYVTNYHYHYN